MPIGLAFSMPIGLFFSHQNFGSLFTWLVFPALLFAVFVQNQFVLVPGALGPVLFTSTAMSSWDVQDLIKEINDMEFIATKAPGSQLLDSMKIALKAKIEGTHLISPSSFVKLLDALQKSNLAAEVKTELQQCLEARTCAGVQGPLKLQCSPQSMTMPFNYLTHKEWDQVQASESSVDAAMIVLRRMKLCGLKSLKEDTKKHLTAFLVSLQMKKTHVLPPAAEMYKLSQFVHDSFSACGVVPLVGGLSKYPPSPYDLGTPFLEACYTKCDMPVRHLSDIASNVASIARQVKIRSTSKELKPAVVQQPPAQSVMGNAVLEQVLGQQFGANFMNAMLEKAKALDAIKNMDIFSTAFSKGRSSSSQSLASEDPGPVATAPLVSPKALPSMPLPVTEVPQAGQLAIADLGENDSENKKNETKGKSLEEFEQEAMQSLTKRKAKELVDVAMKKPAACKQKAKAKAKAKTNASGQQVSIGNSSSAFKKGIYGCIRCRGNMAGCSTCHNPLFSGKRFSSRAEWTKWYQAKTKEGKWNHFLPVQKAPGLLGVGVSMAKTICKTWTIDMCEQSCPSDCMQPCFLEGWTFVCNVCLWGCFFPGSLCFSMVAAMEFKRGCLV